MKFDIIISNPPYQEETGAGTVITGKKPIYQNFTMFSLQSSQRFICTIIPSRWTMKGSGLEQLYRVFEHQHFRVITDYMNWDNPVFGKKVQIAGGVMYLLIDKTYCGNCKYTNIDKSYSDTRERKLIFQPAFIRNNNLVGIVEKVQALKEPTLNNMCRTNTFGLESFQRGKETGELRLLASSGWFNIQRDEIGSGIQSIDKFKLAISGTTPGGGAVRSDGKYKVLASLIELSKEQVCTNTYITIGDFDTIDELIGLKNYLKTKFVRALILATISSMHIIPYSFIHVPFSEENLHYDDKTLYKKYQLSQEEIDYIERTITQWEKD